MKLFLVMYELFLLFSWIHMFMNITFHILVTLTNRVTILELRVFIPPFRCSYELRVWQHCL